MRDTTSQPSAERKRDAHFWGGLAIELAAERAAEFRYGPVLERLRDSPDLETSTVVSLRFRRGAPNEPGPAGRAVSEREQAALSGGFQSAADQVAALKRAVAFVGAVPPPRFCERIAAIESDLARMAAELAPQPLEQSGAA